MSQINQYKNNLPIVKLQEVSVIRTGFVVSRATKIQDVKGKFDYKLLSLKCISANGQILLQNLEEICFAEEVKSDCLTRLGDVLVRLSFPYTAVFVRDESECGLLVSSHFAIVRASSSLVCSEYIYWILARDVTRQSLILGGSVATVLGTISSGSVGEVNVKILPLGKQKALGQLLLLAEKEQYLLSQLASNKLKYSKSILEKMYKEM